MFNGYTLFRTYKKVNSAFQFYSPGFYKEAIAIFRDVSPVVTDNSKVLFAYGKSLAEVGEHRESNQWLFRASKTSSDPMIYNIMGKNYQKIREYDSAIKCFQKAANMVPNRVYPHYLQALLFIEMGDLNSAKEKAKYILNNPAKIPSKAEDDIKEHMKSILAIDSNKKFLGDIKMDSL